MQAIETRYIGPTNHRGARIKATCDAGSLTVPWDYSLGTCANHRKAASALLAKLEWSGTYACGSVGDRYVHVWVGSIAEQHA